MTTVLVGCGLSLNSFDINSNNFKEASRSSRSSNLVTGVGNSVLKACGTLSGALAFPGRLQRRLL